MRIVKVGVLAQTNKGIPLGVQGENRATEVEFDVRPWFREYPHGTVSAVAKRDGDKAPYPLSLDVADGTAVWKVSDTDTAKAGEGAVELTMTSAGSRVRSLTFKTLVTASLTDAPVDDDAWYGWLDKAVVKVDETVQSAQRKMAEVDEEWTGLKADVTSKVEECGKVAAQAAEDAHHAKVDAQAVAKALESAEGSVAKADAAANRAVDAAIAADDSAVEASRSALSAWESAEAADGSATNAAKSAREAETSANSAADAASAASGSASAAEQSATDSNSAKVAAQTAKSEAETAKSEAARSASNAATSASNAADSAENAANSARAAANSVNSINVISPKTVNVDASSSGQFDIAIGQNAKTTANQSIAIGVSSESSHLSSIALGGFATTSKDYEVAIGTLLENGADVTREITHVSAPTTPNSASTKKYTDDNDTKTLTEAKKYTDDNTTNALVGTVSGKLMHVEDAWTSNPLSVTIEGAYKQDGTPSPEAPVPITVVENPVLWVTGRNMLDPSKMANTGTYYQNFNGELRIIDGDGRSWTTLPEYGVLPAGSYYISGDSIEVRRAVDNTSLAYTTDGREQTFKLDTATPVKIKVGIGHPDSQYPYVTHVMLLASSGNEVAYTPYVGTSLPITLPAEHPYLAALPDGTCDTIEIDRYGNVTLVARVKRMTLYEFVQSPSIECIDIYETANVNKRVSGFRITDFTMPNKRRVVCSELPSLYDSWNTTKIGVDWIDGLLCRYSWDVLGIVDGDSISVRVEKLKAYAQNKVDVKMYYPINTPVTYNLGKLDIPSLPETISNVWTDAELTTDMSMTYKRDINIAFETLAQAVVAAAAGE